jgi:teichoic acid transport system permease protein
VSLAEFAEKHGLKRVGARPKFGEYIVDSFRRLGFAWTLSSFSNEASDARTRLGKWWTFLLPAIQAATYGLIFGLILGSNRPENFLAFLFTGVFLFTFMSGALSSGSSAITGNAGLVNSLSFPRVLLPISAVIRQFLNFWPSLIFLVITLLATENWPTWNWLLEIVVIFLMALFASGLGIIAARVNAQMRDLGKLIPFFTRIMFYVSGVFFVTDKIFANYPLLLQVASFNPFYNFIQLSRGLLVVGYEPSASLWINCIAWAILTPVVGVLYFWRAEEVYGRDV